MSFRICAIGCGALASRAHGPSYRKYAALNTDVELVACCDLDDTKATAFRDAFGFGNHYSDFREMLRKEKPDAVCLVVPVSFTAPLSCEILAMGIPLLMEKPPGMTGDECRAMITAAESSGTPNQVAFNRRYAPLVRELKSQLDACTPPEAIQNLQYTFMRINRRDVDFSTTAIHGIDTTQFLAGAGYESVAFRYQELPEFGATVANIFMDCVMTSGATAQLSFCPMSGVLIERATITAHNHTFFLNIPIWNAFDAPGRLLHVEKGTVVSDVDGTTVSDGDEMFESSGFYAENACFFDDIRAGRKPHGDIRSGLESVEIADCIRNRIVEYHASPTS